MSTTIRNASLGDLARLLKDQHARKIDLVCPAMAIRADGGLIRIEGAGPQLDDDGVTDVNGLYRPTDVFDGHVADKLDIPLRYVRRIRSERPDLYDANFNGWMHGQDPYTRHYVVNGDPRSFLFRGFRSDDGGEGVARALLSDKFAIMDDLDILTATLAGVRDSGVEVQVTRCDLTDRRMYVEIAAPAVAALAPELLRGYRSPYSGQTGDENPTVFAGFVVSNSEVGAGAFSITPKLIVQVCSNGMTMTKDAMRAVHLGGKLEHGLIKWSAETEEKNLAVIVSKARDAVAAFLDIEYVRRGISTLEEAAGVPVTNAQDTIQTVCKGLSFPEEFTNAVLDSFIAGGQLTAGGVMQAVGAVVQTLDDADDAFEFGAKAVDAMYAAARLAR